MFNERDTRRFVEHSKQEHDQLRRLLGDIGHVIAHRCDTIDRVAKLLVLLSDQITEHFQQEEEAGFFEGVISRAPRMADQTRRLCEQHKLLKEQIRQLASHARENRTSPDCWRDIEDGFQQFSKNLMTHESEENSLLQEAYGQDIGSQG